LFQPSDVTLDAAGNLYITEWGSSVRKVDMGAGIIITIAGTCYGAFAGDGGPATSAYLFYPSSIALDAAGNLFIADRNNDRIRSVESIPDSVPDKFIFTDQVGVPLSTLLTSNMIIVSGITTSASISIAGGEYSVNSGAFTFAAGMVNNGDSVTVRQTSSALMATTTDAVLTIGVFRIYSA